MREHLTKKADIFSFGVLTLEIISGRPISDLGLGEAGIYLLEWAWNLHENNKEIELVDPTLEQFNENEVKRIIGVALLCTQTSPTLCPTMFQIVAMLSGYIEVPSVTSRLGYLTDWNFMDTTTFVTDIETSNTNTSTSASEGTVMVMGPNYSPVNPAKPMLHDIIGEADDNFMNTYRRNE